MKTVIRRSCKLLPAILSMLLLQPAVAQQPSIPYTDTLRPTVWPAPGNRLHQPWTRWWWVGSAVDEKSLDASLKTLHDAGFGGVEIAPIYGAKGYESRYVSFLSPQWVDRLRYTVKTAAGYNMGVDLTTGTGWPFGGPQLTKEQAASRFIIQTYPAKGGTPFTEQIRINDGKQQGAVLQALTAYNGKQRISLISKVSKEGKLQWTPPTGDWTLYALFSGWTLQQVKRAAPGGEGYTLDHLSAAALPVYLQRFDTAFKGKTPGVRSFYNDSYEVYNADWTPAFFDVFKKHRGYDLRDYLPELISEVSTELAGRVKSDYRETMSELLLNNFTTPWTEWAHRYNSVSKNQAHGSPGNLLDLYAAVDIPECETFGSTYFPIPGLRRDSADIRNVAPDPVMLKFASSAAHVTGHPLVSCETFTWLTEHFKTSLSQCKPEVEQAFLAGVNHVFYHGNTFSPSDVPWPGWLFYASVNFVPTNSFWPHLTGLNNYISRVQSVLQTGTPDNELLIYWPVYDCWENPKGKDMPLKVHDIDEWLHPTAFYKQVKDLQQAGYSLDFVSDKQLGKIAIQEGKLMTNTNAAPYKVLIIPAMKRMPLETFRQIIRLAEAGATIIFESMPEDVPGLHDLDKRRQQFKALREKIKGSLSGKPAGTKIGKGTLYNYDGIQEALHLQHIDGERLTAAGLQFIRRKDKDRTWYYIVNHTANVVDDAIPVNKIGDEDTVLLLDPMTGAYGTAAVGHHHVNNVVQVQLQPGQSLIIRTGPVTSAEKAVGSWTYLNKPGTPLPLSGKWGLSFTHGGPFKPADRQLDRLVSWTDLPDTAAASYSGSAIYTQTFTLPDKPEKEYLLNLGKVYESARVTINGQDAGIYLAIPFQGRVGQYLRPGKNEISIEVANLMANRVRYMDQHGIPWRNYHEINFVNINYKPFDATDWPLQASGLIGPVTLTPYQ
ncbi:alpha-L-rhamnosidase [Chitinophaga sp. YR627]|uniref:glycosyl hydrolase n=1 Tax=Chitinophaga sp. YR627 TaxID=1881041 RepID=UPI0008F22F31|nr:glycosyl hydrolase [Chitinophaga sp. YR627]SFO71003.1 alpha-L-rhamnosidase [Chitinophaga sp. YR627]